MDQAYKALHDVAQGICEALSKDKSAQLDVELEPGFMTNLGQQYRLRLRIPARKWEETLLRAYIPSGGFPVSLDLGDEQPEACDDKSQLDESILRFMNRPEIAHRMSIISDLL